MTVTARDAGNRLNERNGIGPATRAHWAGLVLLFCLVASLGCRQPSGEGPAVLEDGGDRASLPLEPRPVPTVPTGFGPARIAILPLTELTSTAAGDRAKLEVYVAFLDAFGCQIKAPAMIRVEFYEHTPRSARAKGQRIEIWHIDLGHPTENNKHWRDFLRAYHFEFAPETDAEETHVLEVTCLCPEGRRLSAEYTLRGGA